MPRFHDIDLYSREDSNGVPLEYFGVEAVKNALQQWINSKKGEYLMSPSSGGALDAFMFKTLNEDNVLNLKVQLLTALTNQFAPVIIVNTIDIIPDYQNNITEIEIIYTISEENITDSLQIFLNSNYNTASFEYEEVSLSGFNLYEFFRIKKPDQPSSRLLYDYEISYWKWGKYLLINLTPVDPYFTDILLIANGS